MDFLAEKSESPDDQAESSELKGILLKHLDSFTGSLNEKELEVFQKRLFSDVPQTLQEIADQYGITRERIRQIESKVIDKMRKFLVKKA